MHGGCLEATGPERSWHRLPLINPGPIHAGAGLLDRLLAPLTGRPTKPITPNDEFYLTSYRSPPTIRLHDWSLSVKGLVDRPTSLTCEQLSRQSVASQIVTLECVGNTVGGEFISTAEWTGVPLRSLLEEAGIGGQAYDVVFRAADGFSDSIGVDRAMRGDVLIVHQMNGVALPIGHGFPARAIVPGHYGMKSVQWLTDIEVVEQDYKGYYQQKDGPKMPSSRRCRASMYPVMEPRSEGYARKLKGSPLRGCEASAASTSVRMAEIIGYRPTSQRLFLRTPGCFGATSGLFPLRAGTPWSFGQPMEAVRCRRRSNRSLRRTAQPDSMKSR